MIKNLKNKMFISLFILVTIFSVTSSCFAEDTSKYNDIGLLSDYGIQELTASNISKNTYYNGSTYSNSYSGWVSGNIDDVNAGTAKMLYFKYNGYDFCFLTFDYDDDTSVSGISYMHNYSTYYLGLSAFNCNVKLYVWNPTTAMWHMTMGNPTIADTTSSSSYWSSINFNNVVLDLYCKNCTGDYVRYNSGNETAVYIFDASEYVPPASVKVKHEFQSDTSAKITFDYSSYGSNADVLKYSLTGVELNTDLTAPLQLRNPVTYTPRSNKFSC